MEFYEDPGTGYREWEDERELTAEELEAVAEANREADEVAAWEAHYGTEDERDAALVEVL